MQLQSRRGSSASLRSFWENTSTHSMDSDSDDTDEDAVEESRISDDAADILQLGKSPVAIPQSRRGSAQHVTKVLAPMSSAAALDTGPNGSPSAFMLAWRDHLVNQLHQFNESAQSVMPSLAGFNGPLQALQDYQTNTMVRRVSSFFPQRPSSRQREGWWETLTGASAPATSSPPAYGDLYPEQAATQEDWSVKKSSAMQAAADAIADSHFEGQSVHEGKSTKGQRDALLTRKPIERIELSRDRKLFFFWIPILAIVLGLMIRNSGLIEFVMRRPQDIVQQMPRQEAVEVL